MTEHTTELDYSSLRNNVSMLGALLGEVITSAEGEAVLAAVENIRLLSRAAREGDSTAGQTLLHTLRNLQDDQLVPVARAFSQFLNLVSRSSTKLLPRGLYQNDAPGADLNQGIAFPLLVLPP